MTKEKAIKVLRETYCGNRAFCELFRVDRCRTTDCEIYHAVKALEAEPRWMPVAEKMPKYMTQVLVQKHWRYLCRSIGSKCWGNVYDVGFTSFFFLCSPKRCNCMDAVAGTVWGGERMTREEAIKDIQENIKPIVGGKSLDMAIEALKAEPIKHGKWEMYGAITRGTLAIPIYRCSECKEDTNNWFWHYCPNCGAKMYGEENEQKTV